MGHITCTVVAQKLRINMSAIGHNIGYPDSAKNSLMLHLLYFPENTLYNQN
jgi:hypothetical protein